MTDRLPRTGKQTEPLTGFHRPADPAEQPPTGHDAGAERHQAETAHGGHGGHRWMMVACCIPMLIIVGVLVATGLAGTGAILFAVVCLGMMALMMLAMPGGHHH